MKGFPGILVGVGSVAGDGDLSGKASMVVNIHVRLVAEDGDLSIKCLQASILCRANQLKDMFQQLVPVLGCNLEQDCL